jgi:hypothetical protein
MLSLKLREKENIIIDVDGNEIELRFYWRRYKGHGDPMIAIAAPKEWRISRESRVSHE